MICVQKYYCSLWRFETRVTRFRRPVSQLHFPLLLIRNLNPGNSAAVYWSVNRYIFVDTVNIYASWKGPECLYIYSIYFHFSKRERKKTTKRFIPLKIVSGDIHFLWLSVTAASQMQRKSKAPVAYTVLDNGLHLGLHRKTQQRCWGHRLKMRYK